MLKFKIPLIPNMSLRTEHDPTPLGDFKLRKNKEIDLVENVLFNESLIKYNDQYQNDQSSSPVFLNHMNDAYRIIRDVCDGNSVLVEVGCGKGSFLDIVRSDGYFSYKGFDRTYEGTDVNIEKRYLTESDNIYADIVVLRGVFDQIKNPKRFLRILKKIFPDDALIYIEVLQFEYVERNKNLIDLTCERVSYFSTKSLSSLFNSTLTFGNFFNGQYQYIIAHLFDLNEDLWEKYESKDCWVDYDIQNFFTSFEEKIEYLNEAKRLWVWGGSTKGVLFLVHLRNINEALYEKVCGVVDSNSNKQGYYTPSTYFKIISPNDFCAKVIEGDGILVLNPNYTNELKYFIDGHCSTRVLVYEF